MTKPNDAKEPNGTASKHLATTFAGDEGQRLCKFRRQGRRVSVNLLLLWLVLTMSPRVFAQTQTTEAPLPTFGQTTGNPNRADATGPDAPPAVVPAPEPPAAVTTPPVPVPANVKAHETTVPVPTAAFPSTGTKPNKCKWEWVRDGFYLRMLSTMGFTRFQGDGPSGSTRISGLGTGSIFAIGGSLTKGLALAGTVQGTQVTAKFNGGPFAGSTFLANGQEIAVSQKAQAGFSEIGVLVDWYPMPSEGLHVAVGAGLGFVTVVNQADNSILYGTSTAGTLLVGYDWPIAPNWAFGLALVASGARAASLKDQESGDEAGYKLTPFFIGISGSILYF
jgi:hypothetical protein